MLMNVMPCSSHRYLLPSTGQSLQADWTPPKRSTSDRVRGMLRELLIGGPSHGSPAAHIDPDAYRAALDLVERQDFDAAAEAFTSLGYRVRISHR